MLFALDDPGTNDDPQEAAKLSNVTGVFLLQRGGQLLEEPLALGEAGRLVADEQHRLGG